MPKVEFILLLIVLFILVFFLILSFINTLLPVPFIPTSKKITKKMIEEADLNNNDIIYDLGSGDGRLVIEASPFVKEAIGFEINPVLVYFSRLKAKLKKVENTTFITKSVFSADLSKCNKLFLYLSPKLMKKLEDKIVDEMQEGSLIISNSFSFPNLKPIKEIDNKIKIYKVVKESHG